MEDNNAYSHRYFFMSFAASFLVLSVLFLFLMTTVHPKDSFADISQENNIQANFLPSEKDSISVLFIGLQSGSNTANSYILARFNPLKGEVPIIVFPPQTIIKNGDKSETISKVYEYGGADYTRKALAKTLEISIDRYVRINNEAFLKAASIIGSVEFNLPKDINIENGENSIVLSSGTQLLDGTKILDIISLGASENDELLRCQMAAELTVEIVNQRIDIIESTVIDKIFVAIINIIDSDINYTDYDNRKDAAVFLAQLSKSPAYSIPVSGIIDKAQTQFVLNDTFIVKIIEEFS